MRHGAIDVVMQAQPLQRVHLPLKVSRVDQEKGMTEGASPGVLTTPLASDLGAYH